MSGHSARVGALAWCGDMLSSGSRDRLILQRDVRTPSVAPERRLVGHRQEVFFIVTSLGSNKLRLKAILFYSTPKIWDIYGLWFFPKMN